MSYRMFELVTLQNAAAAAGDGYKFLCEGFSKVVFQVTGTFVGTITFKGTLDGTNYVAIQAVNMNDGVVGPTATAAGLYVIDVTGLHDVLADITAYTSGSITVKASGAQGGYIIHD